MLAFLLGLSSCKTLKPDIKPTIPPPEATVDADTTAMTPDVADVADVVDVVTPCGPMPYRPGRTIIAEICAIDQPYFYNRLGAQQPTGTIFALKNDLVKIDPSKGFVAGNVQLRDSKRPRPVVIRCNRGDTLLVRFSNLLTNYEPKADFNYNSIYGDTTVSSKKINDSLLVNASTSMARTRTASFHCAGMNLLGSINSDATWVGANPNALGYPGGSLPGSPIEYKYFAAEEGTFLVTPGSDAMGVGGNTQDQLTTGLFGAVVVQPYGAEYYRSQVTNEDLKIAATRWVDPSSNAPGGLPIVNYNATYPANFWDPQRAGKPVLNMLQAAPGKRNTLELVYTDLTAIITGPNQGPFPADDPDPVFDSVPVSPNRRLPYREFVTIYHESGFTVQAFPVFYGKNSSTIQPAQDAFSINYASGGIGAEIYSNRIGVGPAANCVDCAYEEFFLSAWAVGDPGMVVDVPANTALKAQANRPKGTIGRAPLPSDASAKVRNTLVSLIQVAEGVSTAATQKSLDSSYKATKTLYPDDPSNVYHSYLRDHVKFRVLHGGGFITHVHHQHAHQWLHTPNSSDGHYLDSQILNPGEGYTLEMVHNGSGNLNQTVGDQIFHCHFYPHFAGGMWAMWRVHDVFEAGTAYTNTQKLQMAAGARALPDAEIVSGTPIPGLVPIPTLPMAPVPAAVSIVNGQVNVMDTTRNPGYPFFIPGIAGSRPPHPPLDFAIDIVNGRPDTLDGGLPRHILAGGKVKWENHSALDWTKAMGSAVAIMLPEGGTQTERVAMAAHATRYRNTITPEGKPGVFIYNGLPPAQGAPYADPAIDANGNPVGTKRIYKAAAIQMDVVFNKAGWHYPQQRFLTLWGDVNANLEGIKPPEPFFFRANTNEYVEYWHTNLVPEYYEVDDYQVRTPTDILGQHIHLVKFDVTSSDGAANGWNYEDGTFSPGAVQERIDAINNNNYHFNYAPAQPLVSILNNPAYRSTSDLTPTPPNPIWGNPADHPEWNGAQTTIQRWFADPVMNNNGQDQTLRTVFTHDHFGPSTHQQAGLYAGLLVEPQYSTWIDPMSGDTMGLKLSNGQPQPRTVTVDNTQMSVTDGGPTSYQANIVLQQQKDSYREFAIEFQDLALAYTPQSRGTLNPYPEIPANAFTNKTFQTSVKNYSGWMDTDQVINGTGPGIPQSISGGSVGTYSMNYRNEPLPLRVSNSNGITANGNPGDLSYAFQTRTDRANPAFNRQPTPGAHINNDTSATWPQLPISASMQAGDPYTPLLRAYQGDKIQVRTLVGAHLQPHYFNIHGTKWLFEPNSPNSGYRASQAMGISEHFEMLFQLPLSATDTADYLYMPSVDESGMNNGTFGIMRTYNPYSAGTVQSLLPLPYNNPTGTKVPKVQTSGCPLDAPTKTESIVAVQASVALKNAGGALVYNQKFDVKDPNGLFLVRERDLAPDGTLLPNVPIEPLVLRFNAGDCIQLTLKNQLVAGSAPFDSSAGGSLGNIGQGSFNYQTSSTIGLNPSLLSYDVSKNDGFNVGLNQVQTAAPGASVTYSWYAGTWNQRGNTSIAVPMEYGAIVLQPSDLIMQPIHGMAGAIIIEPKGATWVEDINSRASATVYPAVESAFREFVVLYSDLASTDGSDGVQLANYRTESLQMRTGNSSTSGTASNTSDLTQVMSNTLMGEPETPIFAAKAGTPVRIHLATPQGGADGATFELHGHVWQEEPYAANSSRLGYNCLSEWKGTQGMVGAYNPFEILLSSAGGAAKIPGDYLYRSLLVEGTWLGFWGLVRVTPSADMPTINTIALNTVNVEAAAGNKVSMKITGDNTVNFDLSTKGSAKNVFANSVEIFDGTTSLATTTVDPNKGTWTFSNVMLEQGKPYVLVSQQVTGTNKVKYGSRNFVATPTGQVSGKIRPNVKPVALSPRMQLTREMHKDTYHHE